jgi:hypothetical protein
MPYVVTTKRLTPDGLGVTRPNERRAVATLEEARQAVNDADEIGAVEDLLFDLAQTVMRDDPQLHWDRDRGLIYLRAWDQLIPESGGTVGPLPDGTVIEVEPVEWYWLYDKSGYGRTSQASDDTVIAAYNAREAA